MEAANRAGPTVEDAVRLAEKGFHVFPCKPGEKEPATPHGHKAASNDPEKVRRLFAGPSDYNIGLVPGRSGHVVVDVDSEEGESELRRLWGEIPDTVSWTTGKGRHRLYRTPVPLRSRNRVASDLDVKAEGGYVVVPPSIHPNGRRYTFKKGTGRVAALTKDQAAALAPPSEERPAPPQEELQAPSLERLSDVVAKIPNAGERFASRDAYLQVGYAIKAAAGPGNEGEALKMFQEWASRWEDGDNDPETVRKDFEGMHGPYRTGWPYLLELAGEIHTLAADAFEAGQPAPDPSEVEPPGNRVARFAVPLEELEYTGPPGFLLDGLLLESDINFVCGDGGSMKTTGAIAMACAVAAGADALGHDNPGQPRRVLYVSEEDDANQIKNKADAIVAGTGLEVPAGHLEIMAQRGFSFGSKAWRDDLRSYVRGEGFGLVVFDPLVEMQEGKENSNDDARPVVKYLRSLTARGGPAVLVIHHAGQSAEGKSKIDTYMRGATAFKNGARAIMGFTKTADGFLVEPLKLSRVETPDTTAVRVAIETDPKDEHGIRWKAATFEGAPRWKVEREAAEQTIRTVLAERGRINSTDLRAEASKSGHKRPAISAAIRELDRRGVIDYDRGEHNAKLWHLATPAEAFGASEQYDNLTGEEDDDAEAS